MNISGLLVAAAAAVMAPTSAAQRQPADTYAEAAKRGLDRREVRNLSLMIRVWGFTKYHHPLAVEGKRDWDSEFRQLLPAVTSAAGDEETSAILVRWIDSLGSVQRCDPCVAGNEPAMAMAADEWLGGNSLQPALARRLQDIHRNRKPVTAQHYVRPAAGIGNPVFTNEAVGLSPHDPGVRLLSLARYWNAVRYWFPYRNLMERGWDPLLDEYVPLFAAADEPGRYRALLQRVAVELGDGHSGIRDPQPAKTAGQGAGQANPNRPESKRACILPVDWRFLGERLTVYRTPTAMLEPGDVIVAIDDVPLATLVNRISHAIPSSTRPWLLTRATNYLLAGACEAARVQFRRGASVRTTKIVRIPAAEGDKVIGGKAHDRPGATFQMLPDNIAYLKLSDVRVADIPGYMERARTARGLIVDIRNYPREFVPFALGGYFARQPTPFAKFTVGDIDTPGAFNWTDPVVINPITTARPMDIPLIVLVDGTSMSQAEYTAMALQAVGGRVVGSGTAGADGNVSMLRLPTGEDAMFTGIGVFYPDGRATQRIGIVPDILVEPTPEGVAAGRDEILDAAVEAIFERKAK